MSSPDQYASGQNADIEARYHSEQKKKMIMEAGGMDVYKGKPELWSVLDESFPEQDRIRTQLEIKDARLMNELYHSTDAIIKAKQLQLDQTEAEVVPVPVRTKYE